MSINYFIEDSGEYQLHTEQWSDGGTWITKNGTHLTMSQLFEEIKNLQKLKAETIKDAAEALRFAPVEGGDRWAVRYSDLMKYAEGIINDRNSNAKSV